MPILGSLCRQVNAQQLLDSHPCSRTNAPRAQISVGLTLLFFQSFEVSDGTLFKLADANTTLNSPAIGLLLRPWVTPATHPPTPALAPVVFFLYAKVTLTFLSQTAECELGPVPLPVPVLELPSTLALFRDVEYKGNVLVCVPDNAMVEGVPAGGLTVGLLRQRLQEIQKTLGTIQALTNVAEWITGLDTLNKALPVSADGDKLAVSGTDGSVDLEPYIIEHNWYGDYDWGDQASSAIFVGAPNQSVAFYSYYDFGDTSRWAWEYGGEFHLNTDWDLNVRVPSFVTNPPTDETHNSNKVTVPHPNDNNFNDAVSKIRFL